MGQCQFKTIQTYGQTSGNTGIMVIKEHKICVALSESLYWKHANFQVFFREGNKNVVLLNGHNATVA